MKLPTLTNLPTKGLAKLQPPARDQFGATPESYVQYVAAYDVYVQATAHYKATALAAIKQSYAAVLTAKRDSIAKKAKEILPKIEDPVHRALAEKRLMAGASRAVINRDIATTAALKAEKKRAKNQKYKQRKLQRTLDQKIKIASKQAKIVKSNQVIAAGVVNVTIKDDSTRSYSPDGTDWQIVTRKRTRSASVGANHGNRLTVIKGAFIQEATGKKIPRVQINMPSQAVAPSAASSSSGRNPSLHTSKPRTPQQQSDKILKEMLRRK
jgi:hypothetical protein